MIRTAIVGAAICSILAAGCKPAEQSEANALAAIRSSDFCNLRGGDVNVVAGALNRADSCKQLRACWLTAAESKPIAGPSFPLTWLWSGPFAQTLTLAEATAIQTDAKARAVAATPAGKQLLNITYWTAIVTANTGSPWFLGADAHYGICARTPPVPKG
jgi:hypothetical protein